MTRTGLLLILATGCVLAQFDNQGPAPQRAIIPGSVPLGRPVARQRPQQAAIRRRPAPTIDLRGREPQGTAFAVPQAQGPLPPPPPILAQARPLPEERPAPPPVVEETEEDEDDFLDSLQPLSPTPLPQLPPTRPASLQPAVVRTSSPGPAFRPQRPLEVADRVSVARPAIARPQARPVFRPPPGAIPLPKEDDINPIITRIDSRPPSRQNIGVSSTFEDDSRPQTRPNFRSERPVPSSTPSAADLGTTIPRQTFRQPARVQSNEQVGVQTRPQSQYSRTQSPKKPVAQVLRKYREDNPDGSITWGFENDDGSFKEETIGVDCVVKGKYGYIDPDGVRREYAYNSGIPCDRDKLDQQQNSDGLLDAQNKFILPNGEAVDIYSIGKKSRRPVPQYRN